MPELTAKCQNLPMSPSGFAEVDVGAQTHQDKTQWGNETRSASDAQCELYSTKGLKSISTMQTRTVLP